MWLRGLIKPEPRSAIAYIDWSSQEFGIAAVTVRRRARCRQAYVSGDPYLAFAKQCGAVPPDATKQTHKATRDVFKTVVLGVGYGMEAEALAGRLGILPLEARELLQKHRETYPQFWRWAQNIVDAVHAGVGRPHRLRLDPIARRVTLTHDLSAISRCRPTEPKCCGSLVA